MGSLFSNVEENKLIEPNVIAPSIHPVLLFSRPLRDKDTYICFEGNFSIFLISQEVSSNER